MTAGPQSKALFERAERVLSGGVSSPVRAFRAVGGTPLVLREAHGSTVTDVDGRSYLDFVGSWGPLILGHAHPAVVNAVQETAARGTTFGAPCPQEIELAELVVSLYPVLEQVRFVSSGTEAAMSAIRLARGATGREIVVKFAGCYHGHADHLLVSAGSGLVTFGTPSSAGVPAAFAERTVVLPLDDEDAVERLFRESGDKIAAVILEPIPANNGLLLQRRQFLETLRRLTTKHGAFLIFDEVISGFRVGPGGACALYGIDPDLAVFGKVIGGGLPVGGFGGPRRWMRHLAPEGAVYQAGTLSGNPVAMAAGRAALETLRAENGWARLEELGSYLERALAPVLEKASAPMRLVRQGSLFWIVGQEDAPRRADAIAPEHAEGYGPLFHRLLERGVYLAPSAYEVGFLSLAHTEKDLDRFATELAACLTAGANGQGGRA
ncbi:MAG: glutamate-1-semialdehyde 2,1-aminomutase [Candidatus Eisenbacteria bacterium]